MQMANFGTIMHPCMLKRVATWSSKNPTFSLSNMHFCPLGPLNVANILLQMTTWVRMSLPTPCSLGAVGHPSGQSSGL